MDQALRVVRRAGELVMRRSMFLVFGAVIGYAYGYHHAEAGEPSLYSRAQSMVGMEDVRNDHVQRQRAIEALRQARMDSIEAQLPH